MPKFVPRQRKHKVLAREHRPCAPTVDSNAAQIVPESKVQREKRRAELRAELHLQQTKISSKKQKRLEKYIENKLRKEENLDYLRRLEKERESFDISAAGGFESSRHLNGRKRPFADFVESQTQSGSDDTGDRGKNSVRNGEPDSRDSSGSGSGKEASEDEFEVEHPRSIALGSENVNDETWLTNKAPIIQGDGLARPLETGADGLPVIPMRNSNRQLYKERVQTYSHSNASLALNSDLEDTPWEGFESESDTGGLSSSVELENALSVAGPEAVDENSISDMEHDERSEYSSEYSSDEDGSETIVTNHAPRKRIMPRVSAFKSWATQQLNQSYGHDPFYNVDGQGSLQPAPERNLGIAQASQGQPVLVNGLPELKISAPRRQIHNVQVIRPKIIESNRHELPILGREQEIMEAIHANPVVVIKGETGSGKTTQLPQFLYEAGFGDSNGPNPGMIGITQPRRVAAISMAKRVATELGSHGHKVAHQVRFDMNVQKDTVVKFMTDGILLRELSQDLLLKQYSVIVIDEAHERSANTDILIGMLSKIVPARMRKNQFNPDPKPLKLIIMSATLALDDFLHKRLFSDGHKPPIVEAEGRQHRVTTHFALRSRPDYLEETIEKVKRAHRKLPRGGMLVFLTGQSEINFVRRRLFSDLRVSPESNVDIKHPKMHVAATDAPLEAEDLDFDPAGLESPERDENEVNLQIYDDDDDDDYSSGDGEFEVSDEESEFENEASHVCSKLVSQHGQDPYDSVHILPLYSQLPAQEQLRVFDSPPERSRKIVLSTNIAETSLTIPGIRFVFDCGRSKEKKYNLESGVQSFEIDYISKASAQQRAGRAGRTGPGHCWRLYSSAVYEQFFPDHTEPEIIRAPVESVVLQIKSFAYPRPVVEFPFPTAPPLANIERAERLLKALGALSETGKTTELGRQLFIYPLSPRLGKLLFMAARLGQQNADAMCMIVAAMAVGDLFINEAQAQLELDDNIDGEDEEDANDRRQRFGRAMARLSEHDKLSDAAKLWASVNGYLEQSAQHSGSVQDYCNQYFLKTKAMGEVSQLYYQLRNIIRVNGLASVNKSGGAAKPQSGEFWKHLNSCVASGYVDQVAIRWDCAPTPPTVATKPRRATDVPYLPLFPLSPTSSATDLLSAAIFVHPSSVLARLSVSQLPQFIVYSHLQQSAPGSIGATGAAPPPTRTRMFPLTAIDSSTLAVVARDTALIVYGKPVAGMKIEELSCRPRRRICWVSVELSGDSRLGKGGGGGSTGARSGWPLPPMKVKQVLDTSSRSGWRVEQVLS